MEVWLIALFTSNVITTGAVGVVMYTIASTLQRQLNGYDKTIEDVQRDMDSHENVLAAVIGRQQVLQRVLSRVCMLPGLVCMTDMFSNAMSVPGSACLFGTQHKDWNALTSAHCIRSHSAATMK